ncbi:MAG: MBL fold metallo-hydrolase [Acidimicrobiia bacterium]
MMASAAILGSGQDGGSPQVGNRGAVSLDRSASSVAVFGDDGPVLLLDASPDIRLQYRWLAEHLDAEPAIDAVFVTHGHVGHYAGLLHFGMEAAATVSLALFAPKTVIDFLDRNQPWATLLSGGHLDATPMDGIVATIGPFSVTAIPVPHRDEHTGTVAFSVEVDGEPWLLYLPDIDSWGAWPDAEQVIASHHVSLLDATFSSTTELPDRDLDAIGHPLVPDTIERFSHLTSDHLIVLTHINHSNPLGRTDAAITKTATDRGFLIAHDGLVIDHG